MLFSKKIILQQLISFIVFGLVISVISLMTLAKSQKQNLSIFAKELLLTNKNHYQKEKESFFKDLNKELSLYTTLDKKKIKAVLRSINPRMKNVIVLNTKGGLIDDKLHKKELLNFIKTQKIKLRVNEYILSDPSSLPKEYFKYFFEADNMKLFLNKFYNKKDIYISPIRIEFKIYEKEKLMIGFFKIEELTRVTLSFIRRQHEKTFNYYFKMAVLIISMVGILLTVLGLLLINKIFLVPLATLKKSLLKISEGDYGINIGSKVPFEMRDLVNSFNKMAFNLHEQQVEVHQVKNQLSGIINSMPSMLIAVDDQGKVIHWNQKTVEETGVSRETAIGQSVKNFLPELSDEGIKIINIIKNKEIVIISGRERVKSDKVVIENITIYPLVSKYSSGAVIRVDDVTNEKRLEDQLHQSRKMDAIGQLAGGIAHDQNNMLGGILTSAQVLLNPKRNLNEKSLTLVKLIVTSASRAAELTQKLLSFSRKDKPILSVINIHDSITETISILTRTVNKKVKIQFSNKATKASVLGNTTTLQNALINMGVNSAQASNNSGEITISTRNIFFNQAYCDVSPFKIKPGEFIEIIFRDNGEGISQENIHKIFEPFFTTKEKGKGTGLGMTSVYNMIVNHSGSISVYSEVNKGTVFHLAFPCVSGGVSPQLTDEKEVFSSTGRILLVDDEDVILISTQGILEDMGFSVLTAKDGKSALEIYKKESKNIDLVITDMIMPEMNGRELFVKIKELNPNCKVIMTSGFTNESDENELVKLGMLAFLQKPLIMKNFIKVLRSVFT